MCQYLINPKTPLRKLISERKFSTTGKWVVNLLGESEFMSQTIKQEAKFPWKSSYVCKVKVLSDHKSKYL